MSIHVFLCTQTNSLANPHPSHSFPILREWPTYLWQFNTNSKTLHHQNNTTTLERNLIDISPRARIQPFQRIRSHNNATKRRDRRFTNVQFLLYKQTAQHKQRGEPSQDCVCDMRFIDLSIPKHKSWLANVQLEVEVQSKFAKIRSLTKTRLNTKTTKPPVQEFKISPPDKPTNHRASASWKHQNQDATTFRELSIARKSLADEPRTKRECRTGRMNWDDKLEFAKFSLTDSRKGQWLRGGNPTLW